MTDSEMENILENPTTLSKLTRTQSGDANLKVRL